MASGRKTGCRGFIQSGGGFQEREAAREIQAQGGRSGLLDILHLLAHLLDIHLEVHCGLGTAAVDGY